MNKKSPKVKKLKRLLLLDGNAIVHRAFHGIPPLHTQDGIQVNAVYGFTATFLNVLEKFQPDYIVATFDLPGKTFRHKKYKKYKANRKPTAEDLIPQFALVKDVMRAFNIQILEKAGFEADDIIGTLSVQATKKKLETIIVTGDKDTLQLVNDRVSVFTMSRGLNDMLLYDKKLVEEKMGVKPNQIIDYKGLCGDGSDNIPGVKGVGKKTALNLLNEYQTLDNVYKNLDNIKEIVRKKLIKDKDLAYLSQDLGTISVDVPVKLNLEIASVDNISFEGARNIFRQFEFKRLLKRLPIDEKSQKKNDNLQNIIILNEKNFKKEIINFQKGFISLTLDYTGNVFYGLGVATEVRFFYIPFQKENFKIFQQILTNQQIKKIIFDIKTIKHQLAQNNLELKNKLIDVMLEVYVAQSGKKINLNDLIFEITGRMIDSIKKNKQIMLELRDEKKAQQKTCQQARDILTIHQYYSQKIDEIVATQNKKYNLKTLLKNIELPLVEILFQMEQNGIAFDRQIFQKITLNFNQKIKKLEKDIYHLAGEEFNINSTQQLRIILFENLKIDSVNIKKTKTGLSTASSELEKIRKNHPIVEKIEEYRGLFKLKTTYLEALPKLLDKNNRIHTTFNQAITATGRLSSSNPNLQNIPIRTKVGKQLRKAFVAKNGYKLISADYSQIDLRCIAHISQDKNLIKAFQNNTDIHLFTAATVRGKQIDEITQAERSAAKELNFGLIYGMGSFGFSRAADISVEEAKKFIQEYFAKFPGVKKYMEKIKKQAKKSGFVETIFGRRRNVLEINSKNFQLKSAGERVAINLPIQGLAADIMKLAMIAVNEYLQENFSQEDVKMILQIHDEIIIEVEESLSKKVSMDVKKIMEEVFELSVPLVVDIIIGDNWSEL
jgi:DNA polymerase-1